MKTIDIFLQKTSLISKSLDKTKEDYRRLDPGWYLYRELLKFDNSAKFKDDFIELVYVTLTAWNMNSRGAKLQKYDLFKKSIVDNKNIINQLNDIKLSDISNQDVQDILEKLFVNLNLVDNLKPRLVTYSKTLHFFLPDLVGPIDRTYTLQYFYNNTYVPKSLENQFKRFIEIQNQYSILSQKISLKEYIDPVWNSTIPKIVDNIIIGYQKLYNSK